LLAAGACPAHRKLATSTAATPPTRARWAETACCCRRCAGPANRSHRGLVETYRISVASSRTKLPPRSLLAGQAGEGFGLFAAPKGRGCLRPGLRPGDPLGTITFLSRLSSRSNLPRQHSRRAIGMAAGRSEEEKRVVRGGNRGAGEEEGREPFMSPRRYFGPGEPWATGPAGPVAREMAPVSVLLRHPQNLGTICLGCRLLDIIFASWINFGHRWLS
jgi:hypothetical protein